VCGSSCNLQKVFCLLAVWGRTCNLLDTCVGGRWVSKCVYVRIWGQSSYSLHKHVRTTQLMHTYTQKYACAHTFVRTHTCTYARTHTHTHAHMHQRLHAHTLLPPTGRQHGGGGHDGPPWHGGHDGPPWHDGRRPWWPYGARRPRWVFWLLFL
jgi:hypothetical protein